MEDYTVHSSTQTHGANVARNSATTHPATFDNADSSTMDTPTTYDPSTDPWMNLRDDETTPWGIPKVPDWAASAEHIVNPNAAVEISADFPAELTDPDGDCLDFASLPPASIRA